MEPFIVAAAGLLGLIVGSFLNVVVARLPKKEPADRSLRGRSVCQQCGAQLRWFENIPVFSWLVQRGRCRHCGKPYGIRYLVVEVLTGILFAAVAWDTSAPLVATIGCVFMAQLVAITFIDLRHRIIPNAITIPGTVGGLVLWAVADLGRLPEVALSAFLAALVLFVAAIAKPGGMGMGDVKMALLMGAFLGREVAIGMFAGFLFGAVYGIGLMLIRGAQARKSAVPFGPFLAAGAILAWFWGADILGAYLSALQR